MEKQFAGQCFLIVKNSLKLIFVYLKLVVKIEFRKRKRKKNNNFFKIPKPQEANDKGQPQTIHERNTTHEQLLSHCQLKIRYYDSKSA